MKPAKDFAEDQTMPLMSAKSTNKTPLEDILPAATMTANADVEIQEGLPSLQYLNKEDVLKAEACLNINSVMFDTTKYMDHLNNNHSLSEIFKCETNMVKDMQIIDNDLLRLGHDNYKQLIRPFDTFVDIKSSIEILESNMLKVQSSLCEIQKHLSPTFSQFHETNRKMETLVGSKAICNKVDFLFQLPSKIKDYITAKNYSIAINEIDNGNKALSQCGKSPSFHAIRTQLKELELEVRTTIRTDFEDNCKLISIPCNIEYCSQLVALMIKLNECPKIISTAFLNASSHKLDKILTAIDCPMNGEHIQKTCPLIYKNDLTFQNPQSCLKLLKFVTVECTTYWNELSYITCTFQKVFEASQSKEIQANNTKWQQPGVNLSCKNDLHYLQLEQWLLTKIKNGIDKISEVVNAKIC